MTKGVDVDDNTLDKLEKTAKARQTGVPGDPEYAKADDTLDAAEVSGLNINPNTKKELEKNVMDMQKDDSVKEQVFALPIVDEDDLEERKRRYSFSPDEFGRGIVTSPATKLRKAAKRGLSVYKK